MSTRYEFDVLIAGGGFVGATLALALSELPLRVGIVEAKPPGDAGPKADPVVAAMAPVHGGAGDDPRCTALAHGSIRILDALGVWPHLAASATPIRTIHVSDRGQFGATRLHCEDYAVDALGYVVENRALAHTLWSLLGLSGAVAGRGGSDGTRMSGGVLEPHRAPGRGVLTAFSPAAVVAADCGEAAATLRVRERDGTEHDVTARLLVVADGVRSGVRRMLGIAADVQPYRQQAIIANVTPERFHEHVAWERFTASGPLALLPMGAGRCNLVWTVWNDDAAHYAALDDRAFLDALQAQFGYRLGCFVNVGARTAYPLALTTTATAMPPRCVLVGNAATGVHPVAGQGLNLGLRDVARLAEVIADGLVHGQQDVGASALVDNALRWRSNDRDRVIGFTDSLVRLFTQPARPLRAARSLGLVAMDLLPSLRDVLARQAMGLSGRLPRLARGMPLLDAEALTRLHADRSQVPLPRTTEASGR
jgi:2-octaprenyl-6-methoxyphenol hydroxylase